MPPSAIVWTLETIKAHAAYPTYLQFMRDENEPPHWEMSEATEDMDMWVEWLADNEEAAIEESTATAADEAVSALRGDAVEGATGGGAAAVPMDLDAPRGDSSCRGALCKTDGKRS